ncbi:hypothetical protein FRC12_016862 [Ceratobasidium sp. 428]|nr:hypothetical protein FRC12_016862 [Ceratobasidium sp. 428]
MIESVGLIHPGNQEQIPFAWEIYASDQPESVKLTFKKTFCRKEVDLHFVGVWDTVASVGIPPRKLYFLSDKCDHITHFRHALALDELRVKFLPEHVSHSWGGCNDTTREVWFAGTHSDIGGGNQDNMTLDRGGEPLKWMMEEAYEQGLSVRLHELKLDIPHVKVTNSMRVNSTWGLFYNFLEVVPFISWKEYFSDGKSRSRRWPHLWSAREVLPHQSIHWTVNPSLGKNAPNQLGTTETAYIPKAILRDGRNVSEEEDKRNIKKTIKWDEFNVISMSERPEFGLPSWTNDHRIARLVNIMKPYIAKRNEAKTRPVPADEQWFAELNNYALGEDPGKPDEIWAYGGPQFLQELLETYQDCKSTVDIIRSIIGLDSDLQLSLPEGVPKSFAGYYGNIREQELAQRLQDVVIPRAILLLEGWTAKEEHPKWPPQSVWASVRNWFGPLFKATDKSYDNLNARWNWDRLPKDTRSMDLARLVTDILSDAAKIRSGHVMQDASEKLAKLIMTVIHDLFGGRRKLLDRKTPIGIVASWEKKEAALAEGALNVVMALLKLGNDAPSWGVFRDRSTTRTIRLLMHGKEKNSILSLKAMRTAALLTQDNFCAVNVAGSGIVLDLVGMMHDYVAEGDPVKQQLANEASITLLTLSKQPWCLWQTDNKREIMEKLLDVLKVGKHVNSILEFSKNASVIHPQQFSPEQVKLISDYMDENADASSTLANLASRDDFDMASWDVFNKNQIATKAVQLLSRQDMQVQAAAQLLRSLIDQESNLIKASGEPLNASVVLPEVFLALTASLRVPSRSQLAIDELLVTIVRFLLLKPGPGNKITVSELEAEISGLTTLALAGNPRAILAASAAFAHSEDSRERASQYMLSLAQMITPADQTFLKDSMEVVTVLINADYRLEGFHAKSMMDAVVAIIRAIYVGQLFAEDAPESNLNREEVIYAAFSLLEALCAALENRNYLANTDVFETIILESGSIYATKKIINQAEAVVGRLTEYGGNLATKIKTLHARPSGSEIELAITNEAQNDDENPDEVEDNQGEVGEVEGSSEDTSEDEDGAQETSPLIRKD